MVLCTVSVAVFATAVAPQGPVYRPTPPSALPERLPGEWIVTICGLQGHSWIHMRHVDSGDVVSFGRYAAGYGGWRHPETQEWIYPPAEVSGLHMNREQFLHARYEYSRYALRSIRVTDPVIFRGRHGPFGHRRLRRNCATYARDAWFFYSGEFYPLQTVGDPEQLRYEILNTEFAQAPETGPGTDDQGGIER